MGVYKNLNTVFYLTPKIMYIVVNLEYFIFYSFRHPFLLNKGVSDKMIVFAFAAMQFVTFFSNMGVAYFADRIQRPKAVLIACLALSSITFQLMFLKTSDLLCCAFFILYSGFILSAVPLLDRLVLDYLQRKNAPSSLYGRQRMFGTFTYFVTNYITESLVYDSKDKEKKRFSRLQPLYLVCAAIAGISVLALAPADRVRPAAVQARDPPQITKVLKNTAYLFFLLIILMNGITRGVMTVYLTTYYKTILDFNDLKAPAKLPAIAQWVMNVFYENPVSTCGTFGVVLEIGIFFASQPLLRWLGLYWAFLISQIAQGVRFFAYSRLSPTYAYRFEVSCMIELLKGVNFGLTHLSGVQLAVLLVPSNMKATSQMIYAGTFVCLGGMIGSLTGYFYKIETEKGAIEMFMFCTLLSLCAAILIVVKYGLMEGKLWGASHEIPEAPRSETSSLAASTSQASMKEAKLQSGKEETA